MAGWYVVSGSPKTFTFTFQGYRSLLLFFQYATYILFLFILVFEYALFLFFLLVLRFLFLFFSSLILFLVGLVFVIFIGFSAGHIRFIFVDRVFREFFCLFLLLFSLFRICSFFLAGFGPLSQSPSRTRLLDRD